MKGLQRTFIPGEEWAYVKIYTGHKTADKILVNTIGSVVKHLKKEQIIDKWFFLRYTDPDFHLRVRFHLTDADRNGEVIGLLSKKLKQYVRSNLVWKVQYDTYNRELERYGHDLTGESETIFGIDSECNIKVIKGLNSLPDENYRWMIALKMMDTFLSAFSYNLPQKSEFFHLRSLAFKTEFGFNEYNSKQFNAKYRDNKKKVEGVLQNTLDETDFLRLYGIVNKEYKLLEPVAETIRRKIKSKKDITLDDLISSYIHMMMNRLFRSKNRKHELLLYDFMRRYYSSEMAKIKYKK